MVKKIDLSDVTFLFPMRIDTIARLENLIEAIHFINAGIETNIQVIEASAYNNRLLSQLLPKKIKHTFIKDYDTIFYRTKYINQLVENACTDIVAVWDGDVIVPVSQLEESVQLIRLGDADFVFPYVDRFLDTSAIVRELYIQKRDIGILKANEGKMTPLYFPAPVGGGFFANRNQYIESGIENLSFYGWGRQDGERVNRWQILNYRVKRIKGPIYHLSHGRGINSKFHSEMQRQIKKNELERLAMMSKDEMEKEIGSWK